MRKKYICGLLLTGAICALTGFEEETAVYAEEVQDIETQENNQLDSAHWDYDNAWYYYDQYSQKVTGRQTINGVDYIFDDQGVMQTGWICCDEGWYYADNSGALCNGWKQIGGTWYYLDETNEEYTGLMLSDCETKIHEAEYAFDSNGAMKIGWDYKEDSGWKYYNESGEKAYGWRLVQSKWYYMEPENAGVIITDESRVIRDNLYFFDGNGAMKTGWISNETGWYLSNQDGAVQTGWQYVNGAWYYLDPDRYVMQEGGWRSINGAWYYFRGSGAMETQWTKIGNYWYYLSADGAMRTGWQFINGTWYYFYFENDKNNIANAPEGSMATEIELDGWIVEKDGTAHEYLDSAELLARIEKIKSYTNVPYLYGGANTNGWDCSGFTKWALEYLGKEIPRTSTDQSKGGKSVDVNNMNSWEPGDILVYKSGSSVTHVALYLGDGQLMHALNGKYGTLIQGVTYYEKWDSSNYLADVRRYL